MREKLRICYLLRIEPFIPAPFLLHLFGFTAKNAACDYFRHAGHGSPPRSTLGHDVPLWLGGLRFFVDGDRNGPLARKI